jgi:hypothetical protein
MSLTLAMGIAIIAFGVVMGLFFVLSRVLGGPDSTIEKRLDEFVAREEGGKPAEREERAPSAFTKSLDEAVAGRSFAENISTELARANLKLTPGEYIIGKDRENQPCFRKRRSPDAHY